MTTPKVDLNFDYIKSAIEQKLDATIYLVNGVSLKGKILDQDDDCIIMTCTADSSKSKRQLVYKNAISTVST